LNIEAASIKRVVVAIDQSAEHAKRCIGTAAGIANATDCEIIAITVIKNSDIADTEGKIDHQKLSSAKEEATRFHEGLIVSSGIFTFQKKIRSEFIQAEDPADAICDFCKSADADLVIVGRRGMGFLKGLLLGSVSEKVVKNSPCSVLVAK
jgi:nucleotide-binding universal stress UspA family protein